MGQLGQISLSHFSPGRSLGARIEFRETLPDLYFPRSLHALVDLAAKV